MTLEQAVEEALTSAKDAVDATRLQLSVAERELLGREAFLKMRKAYEQVKAEDRKAEFRDRLHVACRTLLTEVFDEPVDPS